MDAKTLFHKAADQATVCVGHVHDDQLTAPTPCSEWDLRALLNHIVYELAWVPDLLAGKTVAEVGTKYDGDLIGNDVIKVWGTRLAAARKAVDEADLSTQVHLSYGDVPAEHYIREIGSDVAIHGWDVSQSEQCNLIIGDEVAQAIYDFYSPRKHELRESGLFGDELPTTSSDSIQTRVLALLGRKAHTYE